MMITELENPPALLLRGWPGELAPPPVPARLPPPRRGLAVRLRGIGKSFGERRVLEGIDLDIDPGEFVAIVGRSGCGKSTLLRLVAGLDAPSAGLLTLDGPASDVRIMFQDARLLPWKRVADNIALGLAGGSAPARARGALAQVGLPERAHDWPAVLSGGQRQRVALARALVHAPRLLLLDEPLGALDALTRIEMQQLIESLWREHGFTALLVTHDVGEAVALADRVIVLDEGHIVLDTLVEHDRPRLRGAEDLARIERQLLDAIFRR